jgi:hypothetical protein
MQRHSPQSPFSQVQVQQPAERALWKTRLHSVASWRLREFRCASRLRGRGMCAATATM